jgi:small-conductance mechanosensitive channel
MQPEPSHFDLVVARLETFVDTAVEFLPVLGIAVVVVVLSWIVARLVTRGEALFRFVDNQLARDLARQVVRKAIVIAGLIIALEILDATALIGAVLGAAGVLGIAVGFAFRDLVENYIAGILLSLRQPFARDDAVVINEHAGKVVRLTPRATILMTPDGNHLRLPNALVFKGVILNYTRNPLRRFDFAVGVGTGEDLVAAKRAGLDMLASIEAVRDDPRPIARIESLGDSSVVVRFFAWVDQRDDDFGKARSEAQRLVKAALEVAEIEMPEPIYRVHLIQAGELGAATARPAREAALEARDTSVVHDLDESIAAERAGERDLLSSSAPQE